jgi:hypothetical protein
MFAFLLPLYFSNTCHSMHNNAINTDSEKQRAFVTSFLTTGSGER